LSEPHVDNRRFISGALIEMSPEVTKVTWNVAPLSVQNHTYYQGLVGPKSNAHGTMKHSNFINPW
jgi:hypothetical protein